MRKILATLALAATLAALPATAPAAPSGAAFSVRGTGQTETHIDRNGNGQMDVGDQMLVTGTLSTLTGTPIGQLRALLVYAGPSRASVTAWFFFPSLGTLFVTGVSTMDSGPPKGLRVARAFGALRVLDGATLAITDTGDDSSVFTFQRG